MLTCKKIYRDIPFAHRQHTHAGHCSFIHGHNWGIEIVFACHELDSNGFVMDFGKLKPIRDWIETHLDHAILLNENDPEQEAILGSSAKAFKAYVVENCSCEGLAKHFYKVFGGIVESSTQGRAFILEITVLEDTKNSATYRPAL